MGKKRTHTSRKAFSLIDRAVLTSQITTIGLTQNIENIHGGGKKGLTTLLNTPWKNRHKIKYHMKGTYFSSAEEGE